MRGTSPRMRGTPSKFHGMMRIVGDHPRVCGEHRFARFVVDFSQGSSPRMRGTHDAARAKHITLGIIPAYAGNTMACRPFLRPIRDHPRVCGEHIAAKIQVSGRDGIIPAYAGNTFSRPNCRLRRRDHPRVCGEHIASCVGLGFMTGSSPRMRGTPYVRYADAHVGRIIPAYAGNTCAWHPKECRARDHPRVCGEHAILEAQGIEARGSSPRMRGTPCRRTFGLGRCGIIPAYAGNTLRRTQ